MANYKNPKDMAAAITNAYAPFKLDKEKYPDVEVTPYGFIYNVNGRSITDVDAQNRKFKPDYKPSPAFVPGFIVTDDFGDEVSFGTWEDAYNFAKGNIKDWKKKR